jgi:hypothetical protein
MELRLGHLNSTPPSPHPPKAVLMFSLFQDFLNTLLKVVNLQLLLSFLQHNVCEEESQ